MASRPYTQAKGRATTKYEKANYFRTMVRFPKDAEELIRQKAGVSLNGFIVNTILKEIGYIKEGD